LHLADTLKQLSATEFVSGELLARRLGCSRTTINNILARATQAGVGIHAVRGRGYRLARAMSWLEVDKIDARLAERGMHLAFHEVLESTNSLLLRDAQSGAAHRTVALTEWQTAGRGRRGRDWLGNYAHGLTFSLLWRSGRGAAELSGLSLAVGALLVACLRGMGLDKAAVKWPNDILVDGAKLAGVLIELNGDMQGPSAAVIGVGINVSGGKELGGSLGLSVTDLQGHLGQVDRNALFLRLVGALDKGLARFERDGFAGFRAEWESVHAYQASEVSVIDARGAKTTGIALGVDEQGALRLRTGGIVRRFHSGEVSLRGVPN